LQDELTGEYYGNLPLRLQKRSEKNTNGF